MGRYVITINAYRSSISICDSENPTTKPTFAFYECVDTPNPLPQDLLPNTFIMTSPSKKKFEISVADDGTLQTKEITT